MLDVPGPKAPALFQALHFGRDPYGYLRGCEARYGDTFTLALPGDPVRVVISHPEDVKAVFALPPDAYRSDDVSLHLNLGPTSVLFQDGQRHRDQRRLLAPPLQGAALRSYAHAIAEVAAQRIASWPIATRFTLRPQMQAIAFDAFLRCAYAPADPERARELRDVALTWVSSVLRPRMFMLSLAVTANELRHRLDADVERVRGTPASPLDRVRPGRRLARAKARLLDLLSQDVATCRREGTGDRNDILARLVDARYDDGSTLVDAEILDQLVTMLVGGYETTASSLEWALYHLLSHEDALQRVLAQVDAIVGCDGIDPTRCNELSYLDACIRESMRLTPITPSVPRTLTRALRIRNHMLEAGTIVWPAVYLTHHRSDVWEAPEQFRPERFYDRTVPPHHFYPFGGGGRRCLGQAFALFEMRIVLAQILSSAALRLADARPRATFAGLAVSPADRLPVVVTHRRTTSPVAERVPRASRAAVVMSNGAG